MSVPAILRSSALAATTDLAADLMDEIQAIVNEFWIINYDIPGGGGTLTGSPNNLNYNYSQNYQDSGTIVPGVPAYTVTPGFTTPAVVVGAVPGCCTVNWCGPWGKCTTETPGTPAYTLTPAFYTPAVVSPSIPAVTGGYSTQLDISANVTGASSALNPLFSSVTFTAGSMTAPDSSTGLANQTITYNLDQVINGDAVKITGRAAYDNLSVTVAGITTNFGNISTGTMNLLDVPNIPIYFDAIIGIPSFNITPDRFANGVAYELFPQTTNVSVDNLFISTGVTAIADFIDDYLLSYLTDFWNYSVVPLYTAVGASAPEAPSETLANSLNEESVALQSTINTLAESELNSILKSQLSIIQPYVQALTAATWDYGNYPIVPNGNYDGAILVSGLFSGADLSNSTFINANLSGADLSNTNLTGTNFSGANLSGANLSGSTNSGQPFVNSVLFSSNLTQSDLNLSGAFFDSNTLFDEDFNPSSNGLQYFNVIRFVGSNDSLIQQFGTDFQSVIGLFIADLPPCGCESISGLRSDVITGALELNSIKPFEYFLGIESNIQDKLISMTQSMSNQSKGDIITMYKIASEQSWTQATSEQYLFSNPGLIGHHADGDISKAIDKARSHYLNYGFFAGRELNNKALYTVYTNDYPEIFSEIGGVYDESSIASYFVNTGYSLGQTPPSQRLNMAQQN